MVLIMLRKLILLCVCFSCFFSFDILAIEKCSQMEVPFNLTIEKESLLFSEFKTCIGLERSNEKFYAFTSVTKTASNNCSYGKVKIDKVNGKWTSIDKVINPFFAKASKENCPNYGSEAYVLLNRVKFKEAKEIFFISLIKFIDSLGTNEFTVKSSFSDISFFDHLFCDMCSEFEKTLLNNINKKKTGKLMIEYVQTDFTSKSDEPIYSLGIRWTDQLWVVLLRFKKNKLFIKDVSLVQI